MIDADQWRERRDAVAAIWHDWIAAIACENIEFNAD
jgi:hypothetical protein